MAGFLVNFGIWITTVLSLILGTFYIYMKMVYKYSKTPGIPYAIPTFPFGSYSAAVFNNRSLSFIFADIYEKYKHQKVVGLYSFWNKQILIRDLEVIKNVLIKDYDVFQDRGIFYNKEKEPLSAHLFALDGNDWKDLRHKLSPTFTSGKIKGMHSTLVNCAKLMDSSVEKNNSSNKKFEWQSLFVKYGLEVISTTAFGLDCESLTEEDSEFVKNARKVVEPTLTNILGLLLMFNRHVARIFDFLLMSNEVSKFFLGLFKEAMKFRKVNKIVRNDYLQLLIDLKNSESQGSSVALTEDYLAAQAFVFVVAGSDTTASTLSFCFYELSRNPEIQARLHKELDALPDLSYESIHSCQYLDMVVSETLRKYPPLGFLSRECSRDYKIPNTDVVIDKGTFVLISLQGLHNNPDFFPNPEVFDPERFSNENKHSIKPYTYMPFGDGPRFCIGKRFGKMVVKTGLATLLRNYQIRPPQPADIKPLKMEPRSLINFMDGGLWLELKDRRT